MVVEYPTEGEKEGGREGERKGEKEGRREGGREGGGRERGREGHEKAVQEYSRCDNINHACSSAQLILKGKGKSTNKH